MFLKIRKIFVVFFGFLVFLASFSCQIILESTDSATRKENNRDFSPSNKSPICVDSYSFKKGSVVQVSKSEKLGGRLLNATSGLTSADCLKRCCHTPHCSVAAFEQQGRLACYLFDCGDVDDFRCELVPYSDYEVAILIVSRQELDNRVGIRGSLPTTPTKSLAQTFSSDRDSSVTCSRYEFQCHTSGDCIAAYDRCNGAFECPDHSDEENCDEYRQEQYRLTAEKELKKSQQNPVEQQLEDELRTQSKDDIDPDMPLWDRGRNRIVPDSSPAPLEKSTTDFWKFRPVMTSSRLAVPVIKSPADTNSKISETKIQSTTPLSVVPLDRIATTISIISSTNPHDIQQIHIEKISPSFMYPSWINFSDPSHFVISIVLILAIGFCAGVTLFVVCRCICNRKPKVTKYRIVDPEAEDFLLGGTYG